MSTPRPRLAVLRDALTAIALGATLGATLGVVLALHVLQVL